MNKVKKYKSIATEEQINYFSKLPLSALFSIWVSLKLKPFKFESFINPKNKQNKFPNEEKFYLIIIKNESYSFFA